MIVPLSSFEIVAFALFQRENNTSLIQCGGASGVISFGDDAAKHKRLSFFWPFFQKIWVQFFLQL
jgi:hypothetical protein